MTSLVMYETSQKCYSPGRYQASKEGRGKRGCPDPSRKFCISSVPLMEDIPGRHGPFTSARKMFARVRERGGGGGRGSEQPSPVFPSLFPTSYSQISPMGVAILIEAECFHKNPLIKRLIEENT